MICNDCGKEISDGSKICPECGAALTADAQPVLTEEQKADAQRKDAIVRKVNRIQKIIIIALTVIVLAVIGIMAVKKFSAPASAICPMLSIERIDKNILYFLC